MASVKVICRRSAINKSGTCPLRIRLIAGKQKKEITLPGVRVNPSQWNEKEQKVKNDRMLNLRIENEVLKYRNVVNRLYALNASIDLEEVEEIVKSNKDPVRKSVFLVDYIRERFETDHKRSYPTRKNYTSCRKRIEEFDPKIKLHQMDVSWMDSFEDFLRQKYQLADWTLYTRMKIIKSVINQAVREKIIETIDLSGYKLRSGTSQKRFVTIDELRILSAYTPSSESDRRILRTFLFCCFAGGMRFGDACCLRYISIHAHGENFRLRYRMRKTRRQIDLILNKNALKQIDTSHCGSKEPVFGLLSASDIQNGGDPLSKRIESRNAYANKRLKQICLRAGLKRAFSFHEGRHTFFCLGLMLGADLMSLREIGGHANIAMTQKYLQAVDEQMHRTSELFDRI